MQAVSGYTGCLIGKQGSDLLKIMRVLALVILKQIYRSHLSILSSFRPDIMLSKTPE